MSISRRQFLRKAGFYGSLGLVSSYPLFIERLTVLTSSYRIAVPNLPDTFRGFRIVHLSDIHYGPLTSLAFIHAVVERANRLNPDLIACTGDYVHGFSSKQNIDAVWQVMSRLCAPHGVWSVLGNHDHWADTGRSLYWLDRNKQDLHHKVTRIERRGQALWLAGTGDFMTDFRRLDPLLERIPDRECRIVLAHNPDTADSDCSRRIDLMLAGHTHGGQVRIPFMPPLYNPIHNKNYVSGSIIAARGFPLFISRGIGWTILPVRFNCYPEIAVLELVKA